MSDLISRSQLLKEIETWGGCVEALHEYIQNMPTAYDVDEVVEELEAEQQKYAAQALETDDVDIVFRCAIKETTMQTAIDIVKRGGNVELSKHSKSQGNRTGK